MIEPVDTPETQKPDAIFVVHRGTPTDAMIHCCRQAGCARVLLLTPHEVFAFERRALAAVLVPTTVEFATLADLFNDADLAAIDDATTRELQGRRASAWNYIEAYEHLAAEKKNRAARERIVARRPGTPVLVDEGLGVIAAAWRGERASQVRRRPFSFWLHEGGRGVWLAHLRQRCQRPPREVLRMRDEKADYFFLSSLRRLPLVPGAQPEPVPIAELRADSRHPKFAAVALHDYQPWMLGLGRPLRVFVDSFLPSNYPRSYLDGYGNAEFMCPDPISSRWIEGHGYTVRKPPAFIQPARFVPAVAPTALRVVVLLLNHTGDWAALINRSDTDRLLMGFGGVAAARPELQFVIRPHPGAEHPRHEGIGALARIGAFVRESGLANLSVSTESLARDLERGDFFVSEYSATLLEAWRRGKIGTAANLTGRRSLMRDFAELGFSHVDTVDALRASIEEARADPVPFARVQSVAAGRYNALLAAYLGT